MSSRVPRLLLETVETVGVSRSLLLERVGLTEKDVLDPKARVEWSTVVRLMNEASEMLDGDVEKLREIGRNLLRAPSYEPVRLVARTMFSARALYEIANRWIAPLSFPHIPLTGRFPAPRRMELHAEIRPLYEPSEPLFRIFEGSIAALPTLIGMRPAVILESRISPRTIDLVVELPEEPSILDRAWRVGHAIRGIPGALSALEEQRREMADNITALRQARDEIRALLDRLPDMVLVHVDGKIVWANPAFLETMDFERLDDAIGTPLLDLVAPSSREAAIERMKVPADSGAMPSLAEFRLRSRRGREVVVEVAPTQHVTFEGSPARMLVGRDVTERVQMQQKLLVADRLASVGLLAAGVAHEVNNPLGYVLNNIEVARRELDKLDSSADLARASLAVALEGVDRIRAIVRDLLMLSRGDVRTSDLVDVRAVAASTLHLASREIERVAKLVQDLEPAPLVRASEARISQVLLNLVANALEAMRERPRESNELVVRVGRASDDRIAIEVSDTGRGIGASDLPHVFEPFFTTKPAGEGTGLGLSIAQRLVVEIGGEISVRSQVDVGTTFRVLLPAAADVSAAASIPA